MVGTLVRVKIGGLEEDIREGFIRRMGDNLTYLVGIFCS